MSERLFQIITDSFLKILIPGLTVTIPLTLISFFFAMIIALAVALIQFAKVRVLKDIARFYIWVIRGTPRGLTAPRRSGQGLRPSRTDRWRRESAWECPICR